MDNTRNPHQISVATQLSLMFGVIALMASFYILRYGGFWGENDTRAASGAIRAMFETGMLVPGPNQVVYPNGYGFQVLSTFLLNVTGLELSAFQMYWSMLLVVWLVVPTWLAYREFTESNYGGTLATVFLFIQPEFLFVVIRGSHEKFTRGLMMLCFFLILRSLRRSGYRGNYFGFVLLFYMFAFAIVSMNNLLSISFLIANMLALAIISFATRYRYDRPLSIVPVTRRLVSIVLACMVMAFIFTFFIYQPARNQFDVLASVADRLSALFLDLAPIDGEANATLINPYAKWVSDAWLNTSVYLLLSLANWLVLVASFLIWLWQSVNWLLRRWAPANRGDLLLWAFYGAFAIQGGLTVLVDISGAIDGNLQHRIFPSFVMLAAPVVARWLMNVRKPGLLARMPLARPFGVAFSMGLGALAVLSLAKAVNEPLFSNKWVFFTPAEQRALDWADTSLAGVPLWSEQDERVSSAAYVATGANERETRDDRSFLEIETQDILLSAVSRYRNARMNTPLPVEADSFVTYDNGQAQIYHLRPLTPFQR